MIPITLLEHVLKPLLMARGLPVPMLVILVGVLGGTLKAGVAGLFLGPVALSLGYHFVRLWVGTPPQPMS
jgi:predicted PurR-regulated permease PerM